MTVLKALVKGKKDGQYGEFYIISDWNGKVAFLGVDKIVESYPRNPVQWQETYFILKEGKNVSWKLEDPKYFNKATYMVKTRDAPMPIPVQFITEGSDPIQHAVRQYDNGHAAETPQKKHVSTSESQSVDREVINILKDIAESLRILSKRAIPGKQPIIQHEQFFMETTPEEEPEMEFEYDDDFSDPM